MKSNATFAFITLLIVSSFVTGLVSCTKKNPANVGGRFLASTPNENLICEDLFAAACVNPDGTLKDTTEELRAETNEMFEAAQNRALQAMGFASLEEAYLDRIQKAGGFEIGPQENGRPFNLGLGVSSCDESPISGNSQSRHISLITNYYAENLSEFIFYIGNTCNKSIQFNEFEQNQTICSDQLRLRTEVANIQRLPIEQQKERARIFINQNSESLVFGSERPENNICNHAEYIQNLRLDEIDSNLRQEIQTSRPFVETVIDHFYSPENIRQARAQFADTKLQLQSIFQEINPNSPNLDSFQTAMSNLNLRVPQKPPASDYVRNENGTLVLKENFNFIEGSEETYHTAFSDLSLSYFRYQNAFYYSPFEIKSAEIEYRDFGHISMRPAFWGEIQRNPNVFYSVLAHETGHKFSSSNSSYEGYEDLDEKFNDLFECLSQSESIAMTDKMKEEVIADYVSAEMLARKLSLEKDINKRKESLLQSVSQFCEAESLLLWGGVISDSNDLYPPINHRCSGIFGANPNIRKLIGCEGESPNYKSCGLDLSLGTPAAPATDTNLDEEGTE